MKSRAWPHRHLKRPARWGATAGWLLVVSLLASLMYVSISVTVSMPLSIWWSHQELATALLLGWLCLLLLAACGWLLRGTKRLLPWLYLFGAGVFGTSSSLASYAPWVGERPSHPRDVAVASWVPTHGCWVARACAVHRPPGVSVPPGSTLLMCPPKASPWRRGARSRRRRTVQFSRKDDDVLTRVARPPLLFTLQTRGRRGGNGAR